MNIYLIEDEGVGGYDTYDSAVVIAKDEEGARTTDPSGFYSFSCFTGCWMDSYRDGKLKPTQHSSWILPKDVKVTKIGVTDNDKAEVICASFNAG